MRKTIPRIRLPAAALVVFIASVSLSSAANKQAPAEKPVHETFWMPHFGAFLISNSAPLAADLKLPAGGSLVAGVLEGSTSKRIQSKDSREDGRRGARFQLP